MKLFAFIASQKKTKSQAAAELRLKPQVLGRYDRRVPRPKIVARIYQWSGGKVQPNDYYDLPPLKSGKATLPDRATARRR